MYFHFFCVFGWLAGWVGGHAYKDRLGSRGASISPLRLSLPTLITHSMQNSFPDILLI
jgi:hypothetical protein